MVQCLSVDDFELQNRAPVFFENFGDELIFCVFVRNARHRECGDGGCVDVVTTISDKQTKTQRRQIVK